MADDKSKAPSVMVYANDKTFDDEVLKSKEPVLVDFYAKWCGPCSAMEPALEAFASEAKGKVKVVKINVDESPAITQKYNIQAMPTLLIFKGGQIASHRTGALTQKAKLEAWVHETIPA